jgi:hypothetical protein
MVAATRLTRDEAQRITLNMVKPPATARLTDVPHIHLCGRAVLVAIGVRLTMWSLFFGTGRAGAINATTGF